MGIILFTIFIVLAIQGYSKPRYDSKWDNYERGDFHTYD